MKVIVTISTLEGLFPKMGVPLNHPFIARLLHYKPTSYWVIPIYGTAHATIAIDKKYIYIYVYIYR